MNMNRWLTLGMILISIFLTVPAFAAAVQPEAQDASAGPIVIHCGTLLEIPGKPLRHKVSLFIENGRITGVFDGFVQPIRAQRIIDLSDSFVLPGLIDCHTHITGQYSRDVRLRRVVETDADSAIRGSVYANRTLMAGFTTIRNVGSSGDAAFALRDAIAKGTIPGPRILVAGESISPTGGHSDSTLGYREDLFDPPGAVQGIADGPAACRQAVRAQVKRGADVIKLTATGGVLSNTAAGVEVQFFYDELKAIVDTAHMLNRKVSAHAHGATGIKAALRAGVDSIEHGTYIDDECIALFHETNAFLVPTVHAGKFVEEAARHEGYFPPAIRAKAAAVGPLIQQTLARAHKAGVRIAFGTDAGVGIHGTNALEFIYMSEAGLSSSDCIVAATVNAAELLGMSKDLGTIEQGKIADLIAVKGNPLDDIAQLQDVSFVMKDGKVEKE